MLKLMNDMPLGVLGIKATGEVTKEDYENVMLPALKMYGQTHEKINLVIVLETEVGNFTPGAWMNDIKAGLKYITKWHRVAIVTDQKAVEKFTDIFSVMIPGEYKGFQLNEFDIALSWVASSTNAGSTVTN